MSLPTMLSTIVLLQSVAVDLSADSVTKTRSTESPNGERPSWPDCTNARPYPNGMRSDQIAQTLTALGFAGIAVLGDSSCLIIAYENASYRNDRDAQEVASKAIQPLLELHQCIVFVVIRRQVSVAWLLPASFSDATHCKNEDSVLGSNALAYRPMARARLGEISGRESRTTAPPEIAFHHILDAQFGDFDEPIRSRTSIAPEFRMALGHGVHASAQLRVAVQDDLTDETRLRPGIVVLNHTARVAGPTFLSTTGGLFQRDRYGLSAEARRYRADGRWAIGAHAAMTGTMGFARDGWTADAIKDATAIGDVTWHSPTHTVTVRASGGQFIEGERGARVDLWRRYGEWEVGLFGVRSRGESNGGFNVRIPLAPKQYPRLRTVRIRPAEAFQWEYRYKGFASRGVPFQTGYSIDDLLRGLHPTHLAPLPPPDQDDGSAPLGPSFLGSEGLLVIPTAWMPADGTASVSLARTDRRFHGLRNSPAYGGSAGTMQAARLVFLPNVEVSLQLTQVDRLERQALGDRSVSVRAQLIGQGRLHPAVAVGARDVIGTRITAAEYVVASKTLTSGLLPAVDAHLGYTGRWFGPDRAGRPFAGWFGGATLAVGPSAALLIEHDTERVRAGARVRVGPATLLTAVSGDGVSAAISLSDVLMH